MGLVQKIAARLGFTSRADGIKSVRGNDMNATVTAGAMSQMIFNQEVSKFQTYDIILLDEDHTETADMLHVKNFLKTEAAIHGLTFIAMSATLKSKTCRGSNKVVCLK